MKRDLKEVTEEIYLEIKDKIAEHDRETGEFLDSILTVGGDISYEALIKYLSDRYHSKLVLTGQMEILDYILQIEEGVI